MSLSAQSDGAICILLCLLLFSVFISCLNYYHSLINDFVSIVTIKLSQMQQLAQIILKFSKIEALHGDDGVFNKMAQQIKAQKPGHLSFMAGTPQ